MQLMGDALTVLGSRLGITWDPKKRSAYLVRHGKHPGIPLKIHAGIVIGHRTVQFPLSPEGEAFEFIDQTMTPTTMCLGGIDPRTGIHVKLKVTIPFRPRDADFSTIPVLFFEVEIERLASQFRWTHAEEGEVKGKLFLQFEGNGFESDLQGDRLQVEYISTVVRPQPGDASWFELKYDEESFACKDVIIPIKGFFEDSRLTQAFRLERGEKGPGIAAAWCAWDKPVLTVLGELCRFKYTDRFKCINEVAEWARINYESVMENSEKVDRIILNHNLGAAVSHLMAQTLHSWLINTWWVVRPEGEDWFSVWEGSCYFHSTVDVEYTQGPFYLTIWPELLEYQLNQWPRFAKQGSRCLGVQGEDTLYLSHDMGIMADCTKQYYPHEMEIEENTDYILLTYAHWRRTGLDTALLQNAGIIRRLLDFILACDTNGNGIPDKGCANTIDDASPAIQFGTEQVYLGVKALAACKVGKIMLEYAGQGETAKYAEFADRALQTLENTGWKEDHYVVTLQKSLEGITNPWTGEVMNVELEGWDAYHIYTANGLALLDMAGYETGLDTLRLRRDIEAAVRHTRGKYGCRHTSYVSEPKDGSFMPGLAGVAPRVGWVSMNMLRDIAGGYRGVDLFSLSESYWDWQCTTNTQECFLFFETFYGNNLNFYPRGVAVFGYMDAAAGFRHDAVEGNSSFRPVRASLKIPLFLLADWKKGTVPVLESYLSNGTMDYVINR